MRVMFGVARDNRVRRHYAHMAIDIKHSLIARTDGGHDARRGPADVIVHHSGFANIAI